MRARFQTYIAAEQAPVEVGARGQVAAMLDGEIRQAARGVARAVGAKGRNRAFFHTCHALATRKGAWRIRPGFTGPQDFAKHKMRARSGYDKMIVYANKAKAGTSRPVSLADGRGVDAYARRAAESSLDGGGRTAKTVAEHNMVVGATGIFGHAEVG